MWGSTFDFRCAERANALVVELLHFGFLGSGEGEGVAEVVGFAGWLWLLGILG